MALAPIKPRPNVPNDQARYEADLKDREEHPERWALTPSITTQSIKRQRAKTEELAVENKKTRKTKSKTEIKIQPE